MKLVWRTDVHIGDQAPLSRTDDWLSSVLDKLRQVGEIAREAKACAVLDGGDFFNPKTPSRTSHRLVQRVLKTHKDYPCPVYGNVGNHDVRHGNIAALPESPLETLFENEALFKRSYFILDDDGEYLENHSHLLEEDGVKVQVVGVPYHGPKYDMRYFRKIERKAEADFMVVAAHLLASPQGGSMFEGEDIVKYDDLLDLCPNADVFCFGHWHKNQGVTEISPGKWVVNVGSLTRGSLSQDNIERIPEVVVLDFGHEGVSCTQVPLKVPKAEEVFDLNRRDREEARAMTMDAFVEKLKAKIPSKEETKKDLPSAVEGMDLPARVRNQAVEYMKEAQNGR